MSPRTRGEMSRARRMVASWAVAAVLVLAVGLAAVGLPALQPDGAAPGADAAAQAASAEAGASASGSASAEAGAKGEASGGAEAAASGDAGALRTVTDTAGREVQVPAEPQAIAIMEPFSGEVAVMTGAGARIAGMPAGVKSDTILTSICPDIASSLTLSGSTVNIETLVEAGCDVVLVKDTLSDEELKKLDRLGIPWVKVAYGDFASQMDALRLVGQVCGGEASVRAEQLASYYEGLAAQVEAAVSAVPDEERVRVYHSINDALLTDGAGSVGVDWVTRAGCVNVSAEAAPTSGTDATVSLETIYGWRPDLIVCGTAATAAAVTADAAWAQIPAVASGRVEALPCGATRWGHRSSAETALAMLWLASTAYPELVSADEVHDEVVAYYRDYLGVEVDDALYEKILSGEGIRLTGNGQGGN